MDYSTVNVQLVIAICDAILLYIFNINHFNYKSRLFGFNKGLSSCNFFLHLAKQTPTECNTYYSLYML